MFVKIINHIQNFKHDNRGATAIEYALIAAGIAIVIITALGLVGDELVEGRLHRRDEDVGVDVVQPSRGVGSREEAHTTQVGGLLVQLAIERQELERRVRAAALLEREAAEVLEEEVDFL